MKKRDEKQQRKEEEKEESSSSDDYSSNEEDEMERKQSLQRIEPKLPRTFEEKQNWARLIVVLEHA